MTKKKTKSTAGVRGVIRKKHFEEGGTLRQWRGTNAVHSSKKREGNRSVKKDKAIEDSGDD